MFLFGGRPLPGQLLVGLEDSGVVSWIVETFCGLAIGSPSTVDLLYPSGFSLPAGVLASAHQGSRQELQILLRKGAVEPASQSPGFYNSLFLIQKAWTLIRQVLSIVMLSWNLTMILVAPLWPQEEWFANLLALLVEVPLELPIPWNLLM